MANQCNNCGNMFSRSDNLKRHQHSCLLKTGLKRRNETHGEDETHKEENEVKAEYFPNCSEEDRHQIAEVLSDDIGEMIDSKIEVMKQDIGQYIFDFLGFDRREEIGGDVEEVDEDEWKNKIYEKYEKEEEATQQLFHAIINKSLKKLHEMLPESHLLDKYVETTKDSEYRHIANQIIQYDIKPLQTLQPQYWDAEILVRSIENLRHLVNKLLLKPDEKELSRLVWNRWITSEEKQTLGDLSPESIKKVLNRRPIVNYDEIQRSGPGLRLIWGEI